MPPGPDSLRRAAWAGLQDSMPRAALLSIHARVAGTQPSDWEHPALVQVWGPHYAVFVVPAQDVAVFTVALLPEDGKGRRRAEDLAARLHEQLGGQRASANDAGRALGMHPNKFGYAAPTGTVLIRWDGARRPDIWTVPRPATSPRDARLELARRYLHVYGPVTAGAFGRWAGFGPLGDQVFAELGDELLPVRTPVGEAWILAADEAGFLAAPAAPAPARLLPSGDSYWLYHGAARELLVPDEGQRAELWTSRVWPGALLVGGEITGTWRRGPDHRPLGRLSRDGRAACPSTADRGPAMLILAVVLALGAALANAVNLMTQHLASVASPPGVTGVKLARYLIRQPMWLLGAAAGVGSYILQAGALNNGPLSVVQPLLITELIFVMVLRRVWIHQRVRPAAWVSVLTVAGALAVFLAAAEPAGGQ